MPVQTRSQNVRLARGRKPKAFKKAAKRKRDRKEKLTELPQAKRRDTEPEIPQDTYLSERVCSLSVHGQLAQYETHPSLRGSWLFRRPAARRSNGNSNLISPQTKPTQESGSRRSRRLLELSPIKPFDNAGSLERSPIDARNVPPTTTARSNFAPTDEGSQRLSSHPITILRSSLTTTQFVIGNAAYPVPKRTPDGPRLHLAGRTSEGELWTPRTPVSTLSATDPSATERPVAWWRHVELPTREWWRLRKRAHVGVATAPESEIETEVAEGLGGIEFLPPDRYEDGPLSPLLAGAPPTAPYIGPVPSPAPPPS